MKVPFPVLGLYEGQSSIEQPSQTSFSLSNVRPFDISKEKVRGGKRAGTILAYDNPIGGEGEHPVLFMTSVVVTYITPVEE